MAFTVYRIVRRGTADGYVGISRDVAKRWKTHRYLARKGTGKGARSHIALALAKYGNDAFDWFVLAEHETEIEAQDAEKAAIRKGLGSYNLTAGGEGCTNPAPLVRLRMSEAIRARGPRGPMTQETKDKIGDGNRGKKHGPLSEQRRLQISLRHTGREKSIEERAAIGRGHAGKTISVEARTKMRRAKLGRKLSPETCARISAALKGRVFSAEHATNIAASKKGKKRDPEVLRKAWVTRRLKQQTSKVK